MLKDPVIQLAFTHGANVHQVECTLYRLSTYALAQGSNFFASTFSVEKVDSSGRKSNEHPVVLPHTITCAEFDVYLFFGVQ